MHLFLAHPFLLLLILLAQATTSTSSTAAGHDQPDSGGGNEAIAWAKANGGTVHSSLAYSQGGMRATSDIPTDTILASIPLHLAFPLDNRTLDEFTRAFVKHRSDPLSFYYPYMQSLPSTCQNFACMTPSLDIFTVLGARHAKIDAEMPVEASVIMSRW